MNKALFLTFDNTLIHTLSGRRIPLHSKDWRINPEILNTIRHYDRLGYKIIIIDNQESVADGYIHKDTFLDKVLSIIDVVEKTIEINDNLICYSFWLGDKDEYYKLPNPGLIFECALEYELDLHNSVMIGVSDIDYNLFINSSIGEFLRVDDIIKNEY